jgi:type II secretory pathway pseudopilin PulG
MIQYDHSCLSRRYAKLNHKTRPSERDAPFPVLGRHRCGLTLVEAMVVLAIMALLLGLVLSGVQKARQRAVRTACENNLHQIGIALHNHHTVRGNFPAGLTSDALPRPRMTWLVQLLPFLGCTAEAQASAAAYESSPNPFYNPPHRLFETPIRHYLCPTDSRVFTRQPSHGRWVSSTSYVGVYGLDVDTPGGCMIFRDAVSLAMIHDGSANTIMIGERPPSTDFWYGWWYTGHGQRGTGSADMLLGVREINTGTFYAANCPPGPDEYREGRMDRQCDLFHFWSMHGSGAQFLFACGSVRFLNYDAAPLMPALATRAGGETAEMP